MGNRQPPTEIADRWTIAKVVLGFVIASILVYLLGVTVGWERTLARLRTADPWWIGAAIASSLACLAAWAKTWQIVLAAGGTEVPYRRLVVTFFAATFANYVTPFGQAGGEPFIAYVLSQDANVSYEEGLASVVATDLLKFLAFANVAVAGTGYLILRTQLPERVEDLAIVMGGIAIAMPVAVAGGWLYRRTMRRRFLRTIEPVVRRTPRVSVENVRSRLDRLYDASERIVNSPRELLVATGFAYVGWVFFVLPLYFSGLALNRSVGLLLACFVVPATIVAGLAPTPGGLAAIEGTTVGLLTTLSALPAADALAITTVYRLACFWFVIVIGGVAAFRVLARV